MSLIGITKPSTPSGSANKSIYQIYIQSPLQSRWLVQLNAWCIVYELINAESFSLHPLPGVENEMIKVTPLLPLLETSPLQLSRNRNRSQMWTKTSLKTDICLTPTWILGSSAVRTDVKKSRSYWMSVHQHLSCTKRALSKEMLHSSAVSLHWIRLVATTNNYIAWTTICGSSTWIISSEERENVQALAEKAPLLILWRV